MSTAATDDLFALDVTGCDHSRSSTGYPSLGEITAEVETGMEREAERAESLQHQTEQLSGTDRNMPGKPNSNNRADAATLVLKDCGKHWGETSGRCSKCAHFGAMRAEHPEWFQYDGPPWLAVLGEPI